MDIMYLVVFAIFGAVFGSFFNVVGLRIPKKKSIVTPPSHCPNCNKKLSPIDLIPIFSYIILRGKCRNCGAKISPIYMLTEIITAFLFAFSYYKLGFSLELIVALLFVSLLSIIVASDMAYMIIPDKVLLFFLPLLIIARILSPISPWWDSAFGAVVGFGLLLLIAIISNGRMGGGDIKLFFLIGLVLGTINTLLTLFLASFIGLVVGIFGLKIKGQGRKTPIPFGPSIAAASIIAYFYGENLINWYLNFF